MKINKLLLFTFASIFAFAATSCKKDTLQSLEESQKEQTGTMTFRCVSSQSSSLKTTIKADGVTPIWSQNDQIRITTATQMTTSADYIYTLSSGAGTTYGEFSGKSFSGPYYAIYPARIFATMGNTFTNNEEIKFELPPVQIYKPGSYAEQTAPVVAYSETTDLDFKQICGYLKIGLNGSGTISHIRLTDSNNFQLTGSFVVKPKEENPIATLATLAYGYQWNGKGSAGSTNTVTIDCGDGLTLSGTDTYVWFVLPVGALEHGFRLLAYSTDGKVAEINATANNKITRGNVKIIKNVALNFVDKPMETTDACGEVYPLVNINGKIWMQENMRCKAFDMRTEKQYDATLTSNTCFLFGAGNTNDTTCPVYYDFSNSGESPYADNLTSDLKKKLGFMYNYAAAIGGCCASADYKQTVSAQRQGICPFGFRLANESDYNALVEYIGGKTNLQKLKSAEGWYSGKDPYYNKQILPGNNETGFSLLPSGEQRNNAYSKSYGGRIGITTRLIISGTYSYDSFYGDHIKMLDAPYNLDQSESNQPLEITVSYPRFMASVRCVKKD